MLILVALKIMLKSGKQIQRAFDVQYVPAFPDIDGSGTSETLGDALIQGFMMEQAFFFIFGQNLDGQLPLQPPHFHQLCDIFCMI